MNFSLADFLCLESNDVFVDVGAFAGDSMEKFIFSHAGVFKKIIAFEPDNQNYIALSARAERLCREWALSKDRIELVKAGVGLRTSKTRFQESSSGTAGTVSRFSADESALGSFCEIYAMDDYFSRENVTFLKADIEGYEWYMLLGAENIIRRDTPKLAISIYHNASDLFRIILWLDALHLGYYFSVRHHSTKFEDTVLYAYR